MSFAAAASEVEVPAELRFGLADLYCDYADTLDEGQYERWPEFFTEECLYRVIPRENVERGFDLGLIYAESRAMLVDRIVTLRETALYVPRTVRHIVSPPRIRSRDASGLRVTASFLLLQTMVDQPSEVFLTGQYRDLVVETGDGLRFAERVCIYESTIVPTSLVFPV